MHYLPSELYQLMQAHFTREDITKALKVLCDKGILSEYCSEQQTYYQFSLHLCKNTMRSSRHQQSRMAMNDTELEIANLLIEAL